MGRGKRHIRPLGMKEKLYVHQTEMRAGKSLLVTHILLENYLLQHLGEKQYHTYLSKHSINRRESILVTEDAYNRKLKILKKHTLFVHLLLCLKQIKGFNS